MFLPEHRPRPSQEDLGGEGGGTFSIQMLTDHQLYKALLSMGAGCLVLSDMSYFILGWRDMAACMQEKKSSSQSATLMTEDKWVRCGNVLP